MSINKKSAEKILKLAILKTDTILFALKKMDDLGLKLLIVLDNDKFYSLLSIGDIQRAIIKNYSLDSEVQNILRKNIRVAYNYESYEDIKARMLHHRTECMPVIDENNNIINIYFWEDVFLNEIQYNNQVLNLPVVIMAGGKGDRLKPITNIIPKPLVPVGEKPIMEIIINNFNKLGVTEFFVSVNYKAELIEYYFNNVENKLYSLSYFKEEKPLGTAGSLFLLKDKIKSTFFVSNCDIIINQDYRDIYNYHKEHNNEITLVGSLKHYNIPYGILETGENGSLEYMKEKPDITFLINSGMYILEPHLISEVPENTFFHITELIEKVKNRGGKVGVFPVSEKSWLDIGEWSEYQNTLKSYNKYMK